MPTTQQLAQSKSIQQRTGLTFHIATRLLPKRVRHSTYVLYAFFRIADDVVDTPDPAPPAVQEHQLDRIRQQVLGEVPSEDPVCDAFSSVRAVHQIDSQEIDVFIEAMKADISNHPESKPVVAFDDHSDLDAYLRGSAVAVAYMMLALMDPAEPETARPHAAALGEAFQLTNFLRDVREDLLEFNRIYLPRTTLNRTGATVADLASLRTTGALRESIRIELSRAEERYRHGVAGIRLLPHDCQLPVLLAAVFYAEYHRKIRAQRFDVLTNPPKLSLSEHLRLLATTLWHWHRLKDPEAVFYHVSPIAPAKAGDAVSSKSPRNAISRILAPR